LKGSVWAVGGDLSQNSPLLAKVRHLSGKFSLSSLLISEGSVKEVRRGGNVFLEKKEFNTKEKRKEESDSKGDSKWRKNNYVKRAASKKEFPFFAGCRKIVGKTDVKLILGWWWGGF